MMSQSTLFWIVRDASASEAPLERLWRRGSRALSDAELLSVLLRSGGSSEQALEMAQKVLAGGLAGLMNWEPETLLRQPGLGRVRAGIVLALVELTRRVARVRLRLSPRRLMDRRDQVASYLSLRYHEVDQEVMGALYLDAHSRLIEERELYRGTITRTAVEPRAVLKPAFLCGATGVVLFHTHPSGDPTPSTADIDFTHRLHGAAELSGLCLYDHLILGTGGRFVSLSARPGWAKTPERRRILPETQTSQPGGQTGQEGVRRPC